MSRKRHLISKEPGWVRATDLQRGEPAGPPCPPQSEDTEDVTSHYFLTEHLLSRCPSPAACSPHSGVQGHGAFLPDADARRPDRPVHAAPAGGGWRAQTATRENEWSRSRRGQQSSWMSGGAAKEDGRPHGSVHPQSFRRNSWKFISSWSWFHVTLEESFSCFLLTFFSDTRIYILNVGTNRKSAFTCDWMSLSVFLLMSS